MFQVPKRKVKAMVALTGHPLTTMWLYLCDSGDSQLGRERPSDLLNKGSDFIPVADADDNLVLLQKDAIMLVSVDAEQEVGAGYPEEVEQAGLVITHNLEMLLVDGTQLSGSVSYLRPDGGKRLQDFVNDADQFIPVRNDDTVVLVSRQCIASITPSSAPDRNPRRRAEDG